MLRALSQSHLVKQLIVTNCGPPVHPLPLYPRVDKSGVFGGEAQGGGAGGEVQGGIKTLARLPCAGPCAPCVLRSNGKPDLMGPTLS
jgi:hypothetical protein